MQGRPLKVPESFDQETFTRLYHGSQHPREKIRYLALSLLQQRKRTASEVAAILRVSRMSVTRWLQRYRQHGIDGLKQQPGQGRQSLLSPQQIASLKSLVQQLTQERPGGRIMGKHVRQALCDQGVACSLASVYAWLHKARLSWVASRSRHPQSDPEAQREFQKKIRSSRARGRGQQGRRKTSPHLVSRRGTRGATRNNDTLVGGQGNSAAGLETARV